MPGRIKEADQLPVKRLDTALFRCEPDGTGRGALFGSPSVQRDPQSSGESSAPFPQESDSHPWFKMTANPAEVGRRPRGFTGVTLNISRFGLSSTT